MTHLRAALVLSLAFGLLAFGLLAFGLSAGLFAPATAGAEGPASSSPSSASVARFTGFVFAESGAPLPTKVRAYGAHGLGGPEGPRSVVCGTGDVRPLNDEIGSFEVTVTGHGDRAGCPEDGGLVTLWLLYGRVDHGVPASTQGELTFATGEAQTVLLGEPGAFGVQGWTGHVPRPGGVSAMRWTGPSVATSDALALLGVPVRSAWHRLPATGERITWMSGAPDFVQTYPQVHPGDIVVIRAR